MFDLLVYLNLRRILHTLLPLTVISGRQPLMPDHTSDLQFMDLAVEEARRALSHGEVPVGCVFVKNGEVIGAGHNDTNRTLNGTRHAEMCTIDRILANHKEYPAEFTSTDLYVTVEPCLMCASALRQIGIKMVYFGAGNERFGGCGSVLAINRDLPTESLGKSYPVVPGLRRREAVILLRDFYTQQNPTAPVPKAKRQRTVKEDIPPINFQLYMTEKQFTVYFGEDRIEEYTGGKSSISL